MLKIFFFFLLCICSILASAPWLNEDKPNSTLTEGDIALKDAPDSNEQTSETEYHLKRAAASETIRKWENKIVPYNILLTFNKKQRQIILGAMMEVEDNTCISFVERKLEKDYILFKKLNHGSRCSSIVGRQKSGGRQLVNLTDKCVERKTVLHELMHALGFHHEHSRHDRDKYIEIDLNNVRAEDKQGFKFVQKVDQLDLHLPYDYKSVIHYSVNASSIYSNGITIRSKFPWFKIKADSLSDIDIWKIKNKYNCSDSDKNVKEQAEVTTTNVSNIGTTAVDQQRRYPDETNASRRTTSQLPTVQSTTTSIGTTSTTTRPISILNKEIIKAVEERDEAKVEQLLNEGADVNARTIGQYRNKTLLHIASKKGDENVVSLLLAYGANVNDNNPLGDAAIHKAAESGYANIVSLLLAYNVSVEMKGEYDQTPLLYAARHGHVSVVSLILDKGANIEARSKSNYTPLHYAAVDGHVNVVSLLVDKGANIEARSSPFNCTPLHSAAVQGHLNIVSLLLDKGANIETRNTNNWTPLHDASFFGRKSVVLLLLDNGANIEAKTKGDETPLDLAKHGGRQTEIVQILERKERQLTG